MRRFLLHQRISSGVTNILVSFKVCVDVPVAVEEQWGTQEVVTA